MNEQNPYEARKIDGLWGFVAIYLCGLVLSFVLTVKRDDNESVYVLNSDVRLPGMCASRRFFDFNCPGCGLTRSIVCISHGDFQRALRFNPGGFAVYFCVVLFLFYAAISRALPVGSSWHHRRFWTIVLWTLFVVLIVQWLARAIWGI